MRTPGPFPESLRHAPFTLAEARAAGVSRSRLRSSDVRRFRRGVYVWCGTAPMSPLPSDTPPPEDGGAVVVHGSLLPPLAPRPPARGGLTPEELTELRALARTCPDLVVTGATAARCWGWPEVPGMRGPLQTVRPRPRKRPVGEGHAVRRRTLTEEQTRWDEALGLRFTTVEETWFQLARTVDVDGLVTVGDFLVRTHRPRGAPAWSWSTVRRLEACLAGHRRRHGIRAAREALSLVRDGADSPMETALRLALGRAGLPEPVLQVELWDPAYSLHVPATGDIAYPEAKVVVQYEGAHHDDPVQVERDTRRDAAFLRAGWLVIRVSRSDLRDGFAGTVELVRRALAERSPETPPLLLPPTLREPKRPI